MGTVRTGEERLARARAVQRFTDWYVVTGVREDTVTTEQVRKDWWLAHQDLGVSIPKAERANGVAHLKALGAAQGRGVLRGVAESDVLLDDAAQALREGLEARDAEEVAQ